MVQVSARDTDAGGVAAGGLHPDVVGSLVGRSLGPGVARAVGELFGALADPSRIRIVHLLAISETDPCVRDMAFVLGMSLSALSHQLRSLRERGAVERRKVGRIAYYRLVDDHLRELVLGALSHIEEGAAASPNGRAVPARRRADRLARLGGVGPDVALVERA